MGPTELLRPYKCSTQEFPRSSPPTTMPVKQWMAAILPTTLKQHPEIPTGWSSLSFHPAQGSAEFHQLQGSYTLLLSPQEGLGLSPRRRDRRKVLEHLLWLSLLSAGLSCHLPHSSPIKEDSPEIWLALSNLLVAAGSPAVSLSELILFSRRCLLIPPSTQYQDQSSPHTRSQLAICRVRRVLPKSFELCQPRFAAGT